MEMEENTNLATEVLHEIKMQSQRYFILLIIAIIVLFLSNLMWAYAWNNVVGSRAREFNLNGHGNAKVVYNTDGKVGITEENH